MKSPTLVLLMLSLVACSPGKPCPTCEDVADEDPIVDFGSVSDLPCGGADLENDHLNCGACGNECSLRFSEYGVGSCREGECDPADWEPWEWPEVPAQLTCDQVCSDQFTGPESCVTRGCSDLTALVCGSIIGQPCQLFYGQLADLEFGGACDEPIPWPVEVESGSPVIYCCCEP